MNTTTSHQRDARRMQLPVIWRAADGVLTQDLLLEPGKFGLGRVPEKLKPDATTQMVCGFC